MFDYMQKARNPVAAARHCSDEDVFPFGLTRFSQLLGELGYVHKDSGDDRERLKMQEHVLLQREKYLIKIDRLRSQGYVVFYMDETWVNKNMTRKKAWEMGDSVHPAAGAAAPRYLRKNNKKAPIGKGARSIVVGIGSRETGIVDELLKIFRGSKSKVGDYHKEMNATVFEEWMESVLTWIKEK
jgi:hypothetical protein